MTEVAGARTPSGGRLALVVCLLLASAVGLSAAAATIEVGVDAPDRAEPGDTVEVTYELTNEGDESTDALGLNLTAVPDGVAVESIESADGSVAERRNAVFWIDPVDPGETVRATFVISAGDDAAAGDRLLSTEISTSVESIVEETTIAIEDGDGDGGDDSADGGDGAASDGDDGHEDEEAEGDENAPLALSEDGGTDRPTGALAIVVVALVVLGGVLFYRGR